ncbi:MAG: 2-dehydropantoate 2-reductase [Eubacteriales bacterium]|nr:2-dehydropantoate 2-reductase [Eubacteriales bacterium]MDD4389847.1 2-dehydropantoate 2-reductase [Eubacteriales bacterium]
MKIAIVGIGGIGGFVGGALAKEYPDETYFIVRGDKKKAILENGMTVKSVLLGEFNAMPAIATDKPGEIGVVDVIFLANKGHVLADVCKQITPMIGPNTVIIPLLNGVMLSEIMEPLLPPCIIADGTIYIFSALTSPGVVEQTAGSCKIVFGLKDRSRPPILDEIAERLNKIGILCSISDNIAVDSWHKYVMMCGNSVVFCHYDAPAGGAQEQPDCEEVNRAVTAELVAVAKARGVTLPDDTADERLDDFMSLPPQTMSSLFRDLSTGKPAKETELFHIIGRMVDLAAEEGIDIPYHNEALQKYSQR